MRLFVCCLAAVAALLPAQAWQDCSRASKQRALPDPSRTMPFPTTNGKKRSSAKAANFIDDILFALQDRDRVPRAEMTNDLNFLRRATVDLTGRIPSLERTLSFIDDDHPDKRAAYIDELTASEAFVSRWAYWFGELFQISMVVGNEAAAGKLALYLEDAVRTDKPLNRMATELVTALGNTYEDGLPTYLLRQGGLGTILQDRVENEVSAISAQFLGIDTNCISCHGGAGYLEPVNHYLSQKERKDLWAFSAFTAQKRFLVKNNSNLQYGINLEFVDRQYTTNHDVPSERPDRVGGGVQTPTYLFTGEQPAEGEDHRAALARMVTDDFQFARNFANRFWAHFMSVGLVEPLDGFDPTRLDPENPPPEPWDIQPLQPELLERLAQYFIDSNYSMKTLIKLLVNSSTYQLSANYPYPWNPEYAAYYPKRIIRPLTGEEILDQVIAGTGTGYNEDFSYRVGWSTAYDYSGEERTRLSRTFAYVHQMTDISDKLTYSDEQTFLRTFGIGNRYDISRADAPTPTQSLVMMNHESIQKRLTIKPLFNREDENGNQVPVFSGLAELAFLKLSNEEKVRRLYLSLLVREPYVNEMRLALRLIGKRSFAKSVEDLAWVLVNYDEMRLGY
ncbi:MAG: DUF1553 domain-containing protein [Acidobacteriota bacterium]|nr:DUF1553 domain-containing protein [Acidobacteriota bacterium]